VHHRLNKHIGQLVGAITAIRLEAANRDIVSRCVVGHVTSCIRTCQAEHLGKSHEPAVKQFLGRFLGQSAIPDIRFVVRIEIPVDFPRACAAVEVDLPSQPHMNEPDRLQRFVECSRRVGRDLITYLGDLEQLRLSHGFLLPVCQFPGLSGKSVP